MPGSGGAQRLPRVMGDHRAKELIMSGEQFTAQEALAWGLVNKVLPPAELLAATLEAAARIAGNPPRAVQMIQQCIHTGLQADIDTGLVLEAVGHQRLTSAEARPEGIGAFFEKRKPTWTKT